MDQLVQELINRLDTDIISEELIIDEVKLYLHIKNHNYYYCYKCWFSNSYLTLIKKTKL